MEMLQTTNYQILRKPPLRGGLEGLYDDIDFLVSIKDDIESFEKQLV
jgi:hypothetical protein